MDRPTLYDIEVPTGNSARLLTGKDAALIGVDLDIYADIEEGHYQVAFTPAEVRELHAALETVLKEIDR